MSSNYPPGVSGNEIEITGPDEFFNEFTCPNCAKYEEEQLFYLFRNSIETTCWYCKSQDVFELEEVE